MATRTHVGLHCSTRAQPPGEPGEHPSQSWMVQVLCVRCRHATTILDEAATSARCGRCGASFLLAAAEPAPVVRPVGDLPSWLQMRPVPLRAVVEPDHWCLTWSWPRYPAIVAAL